MGNPSGSRGEAAYARAMAAFQEGSLDVAKRLVTEALADDPHHPGARALRTRIDARLSSGYPGPGRPSTGRGGAPEATSVDPTILIDRATQRAPEYVEPTVLIQRDDLPGYGAPRHDVPRHDPPRHDPPRRREERETDPFPPPSSRAARSAPAPEPTILIAPKKKNAPSASSSSRAPSPSGLRLLWLRLTGGGGASPASQRSYAGKGGSSGRQAVTGLSPAARGALLVLGGLVVAAVFVFGVVALVRSVWTPGNVLTLTKPVGGTLVGAGLSCGSRGSECSTTKPATETVELQAVADSGYVFSGFTGDCAPSGRVSMSQARSCGATFGQVTDGGASTGVAWPLTITKPAGGTVVAAGGIICGTLGSTCEIKLPDGAPVTLTFEADANFQFLNFTGDCAANGETIMSAARTCGATFTPTEKQVVSVRPPADPPRSGTRPAPPPPGGATTKPAAVTSNPVPTGQAPPAVTTIPPSAPTPTAPPVTVAADKPPPPESEEEHAKKEIAQLLKNYCAELETMNPARIQKIFPLADVRTLREQYKNYKSLQCTLTGDPEYQTFDVKGAGGAQLKIGMKQVIAAKIGGAPQTQELILTIRVSRIDNRTAWTIDRVNYALKPK